MKRMHDSAQHSTWESLLSTRCIHVFVVFISRNVGGELEILCNSVKVGGNSE